MPKYTAILKSRVGAIDIDANSDDPLQAKKKYSWNEKNNFTLEVPTFVGYTNAWGHQVVVYQNFAQHLLDKVFDVNKDSLTFGEHAFELVKTVEKPDVVAPVIVDRNPKKVEPETAEAAPVTVAEEAEKPQVVEPSPKVKSSKTKEKKNETVTS